MRVNFDVDPEIWHLFRKKCLETKITASEKLRRYVQREVTI